MGNWFGRAPSIFKSKLPNILNAAFTINASYNDHLWFSDMEPYSKVNTKIKIMYSLRTHERILKGYKLKDQIMEMERLTTDEQKK